MTIVVGCISSVVNVVGSEPTLTRHKKWGNTAQLARSGSDRGGQPQGSRRAARQCERPGLGGAWSLINGGSGELSWQSTAELSVLRFVQLVVCLVDLSSHKCL